MGMAINDITTACIQIIEHRGDSVVAKDLGIKVSTVWQVRNRKKPLPMSWADALLALEGLEVLVLQKTP